MGALLLKFLPKPLLSFLAMIVGARRNYSSAIRLYKEILERDKEDTMALAMVMNCCKLSGDKESAFLFAQKILDIEPKDFDALHCIASYYLDQENHDQAYSFICRALEYSPKSYDLSNEMSSGYLMKGFDKILPSHANLQEAQNSLDATFDFETDWLKWAKNYKAWYEKQNFPHR